jgi:O-antigen/teichoic acid export membrane protein
MKPATRTPITITARLLTRNWTLNLISQVLSLLTAVPTIPYLVHGLGAERFGILSLAWVFLGYFGLFDLGLGRATTKFVAGCLGSGETHRLPALVWTSLWSQVLFGAIGALVAALVTPVLVHHVLKITPALVGETELSFYILAASLPLVLGSNSMRGVLEAGQHFGAVNYVRVPANACLFLLPALAVLLGARLPLIVALLALARLGSGVAYVLLCFKFYPVLRVDWSIDPAVCRSLLAYGGWVTVSNFIGPLLSYLDRLAIGSMISMAAVGFYTAPSEAIGRLSVVPSSLSTTIFPAFSSLDAAQSPARLEELCVRSLKALLLTLGPITLLVILFAHEILRLWLGPEFAAKGATVLQILAAGALLNSLAFVPFGLLQALGRPDLTAKFHLLELPIYVSLLWFLVRHMGITGAAWSWSIRICLDTALLMLAVFWLRLISISSLMAKDLRKTAAVVCGFGILLAAVGMGAQSLRTRGLFSAFLALAFGLVAWAYVLDGKEKRMVLSTAANFRADGEEIR